MQPSFINGYIINPTEEVTPSVRISPFRDKYICTWRKGDYGKGRRLMNQKFADPTLHLKARYAITAVLRSLKLKQSDRVTILTTSGNSYISRCVTDAISQVCQWNMTIDENTSAILVNHEFGYEFKDIVKLKSLGIPIIEDCAHLFSHSDNVGRVGDYVIYSLPKIFPMQIGCIVNRNNPDVARIESIDSDSREYILKSLSLYLPEYSMLTEQTQTNYNTIKIKLSALGLYPFFDKTFTGTPNVFMFRSDIKLDYPNLKIYMQKNGVESSVFYGKEAFFIPSNWGVNNCEIEYMTVLLQNYINKNGF